MQTLLDDAVFSPVMMGPGVLLDNGGMSCSGIHLLVSVLLKIYILFIGRLLGVGLVCEI